MFKPVMIKLKKLTAFAWNLPFKFIEREDA